MKPETRCSFCFAITDGAEYCSTTCEELTRDFEESVVVYPLLRVVTADEAVRS